MTGFVDVGTADIGIFPAREASTATEHHPRLGLRGWSYLRALAVSFQLGDPIFGSAERTRTSLGQPITSTLLSATDRTEAERTLATELSVAVAEAARERFEEGVESVFVKRLRKMIDRFGSGVLVELREAVARNRVPPDIAFEGLLAVAELRYSSLATDFTVLVETALSSRQPEIRYGACLAAITARNHEVLPSLEYAAHKEPIREVRTAMLKAANALRRPPSDATSSQDAKTR